MNVKIKPSEEFYRHFKRLSKNIAHLLTIIVFLEKI